MSPSANLWYNRSNFSFNQRGDKMYSGNNHNRLVVILKDALVLLYCSWFQYYRLLWFCHSVDGGTWNQDWESGKIYFLEKYAEKCDYLFEKLNLINSGEFDRGLLSIWQKKQKTIRHKMMFMFLRGFFFFIKIISPYQFSCFTIYISCLWRCQMIPLEILYVFSLCFSVRYWQYSVKLKMQEGKTCKIRIRTLY